VTVLDVTTVLNATPVCGVKLNASGVVSSGCARVVTENAPATPPIVNVAVVVVLNEAEEVCRTATFWPGLIVPAVVTNAAPLIL
jgi:hypothetical protein